MLRALTLFQRSLLRTRRRRSKSSTDAARHDGNKLSDDGKALSDGLGSVSYYKHNRLPDARAIRLLDLLPGAPDDPISCDIAQHTFTDSHKTRPYIAISYHWGDSNKSQSIYINKQEFRVTKNAEEVLRQLRDPDHTKTVWIDAICIDQNNEAEKHLQIRLMGMIYAASVETVIYIGPAFEESDVVFDFIRENEQFFLAASAREFKNLQPLFDIHGFSPRAPIWIDVIEVTSRPWFSRLWVVQELCLSPRATLCCGDRSITWEVFEAALRCCTEEPASTFDRVRYFNGNVYVEETMRMAVARRNVRRSENLTLEAALGMCSLFQAKEPRDYIFGLLGLINQDQLQIAHLNYGDRVEHIYQTATEAAIDVSNELTVLFQAEFPPVPSMLQLPSWVPDYSKLEQTKVHPLGTVPEAIPNVYAGHAEKHAKAPRPTFHDGVMTVPGVTVSTIMSLSPLHFWSDRNDPTPDRLDWYRWTHKAMEMTRAFGKSSCGGGELDALAWTLTHGRLGAPERCREYFSVWKDLCLTKRYRYYEDMFHVSRFLRQGTDWTLDKQMCAKAIEFAKHMEHACHGRRFCVTADGMLAIVPRPAKVGDNICVLLRSSLPFVLRPIQDPMSDTRRFQMVGTCYANGIMNGEAFENQTLQYIEIM